MKTFMKNTPQLHSDHLIKEALQIITGEVLQYDSNDENTFTICKDIKISLKNSHYRFEINSKIVDSSETNRLLNFIIVKTIEQKGFLHFNDRCLDLNELHIFDQKLFRRLSFYPFFGEREENIYQKILFTKISPQEFSDEFDLSKKLVQSIRALNRKAILSSIVKELTTNRTNEVAA